MYREREFNDNSLHNMVMVPENSVKVIICSRVKPEVHSLFSIAFSICIDIGLDRVRLTRSVSQELKIKLVSHIFGVGIHLLKN